MAEVIHYDAVEQILLGLDVEDLIRCKRVCKSWYSLIKSRRFINHHLNRSYHKDHHNNEFGNRRIVLAHKFHDSDVDDDEDFCSGHTIVGSSNGLVCVAMCLSSFDLSVGNPSTREVIRRLKTPRGIGISLFYGFGYDSSSDDYKVILVAQKNKNKKCVRMLSLKSNVWRVISGEVKYRWFINKVGIYCNDALHWITSDDENDKKMLIIAFDLSKEEFKEIPQPDDPRYRGRFCGSYLAITKGCLCICHHFSRDVWSMKEYNVKQWVYIRNQDGVMNYDIMHYLSSPEDGSFFHTLASYSPSHYACYAHVFVRSLVSPHLERRQKRPSNNKGAEVSDRC